jgi:hypothetical protein
MSLIDRIDPRRRGSQLAAGRPDEAVRRFQKDATFVAACRSCGVEFRSWDDALEHAESKHGPDRASSQARALIHWY